MSDLPSEVLAWIKLRPSDESMDGAIEELSSLMGIAVQFDIKIDSLQSVLNWVCAGHFSGRLTWVEHSLYDSIAGANDGGKGLG